MECDAGPWDFNKAPQDLIGIIKRAKTRLVKQGETATEKQVVGAAARVMLVQDKDKSFVVAAICDHTGLSTEHALALATDNQEFEIDSNRRLEHS